MILASSNQKVFSAGLDILEMYQPQVRYTPLVQPGTLTDVAWLPD